MQRAQSIWICAGAILGVGVAIWLVIDARRQNDEATAAAQFRDASATRTATPTSATDSSSRDVIQRDALSSPTTKAEDGEKAAYLEWQRKIVDAIASNGDANSLAAAASILNSLRPEDRRIQAQRTMSLLERASALAPANASIQALALQICWTLEGCEPSRYSAALREIDPKNSAAWLDDAAKSASDHSARRVALENIASGENVTTYFVENTLRVSNAIDAARVAPPTSVLPTDPLALRNAMMVDVFRSQNLPAFMHLIDVCGPARDATLTATCLQAGAVLEHSDTLLTKMVGVRLQSATAKPESEDARRIEQASRDLDWLRQHLRGISFDVAPGQWLRLLDQYHDETEMMRQLLLENGIPDKPPARGK